MTNFVPLFPLNVVVFPGEQLNLHIFEPRYKQMIAECVAQQKPFGLPPVLTDSMGELGTLIEIVEVAKTYDNGELDVRTRGVSVFRMLTSVPDIPDKLYGGAIVNYPANVMTIGNSQLAVKVTDEVRRLYELLNVQDRFPADTSSTLSYLIGHFVGFTKAQEYELLGLFSELQRLEYIRRHLKQLLPLILELEEMKARIRRNGHFQNLSLGDVGLA